jgi:hypothetical protein
VRATSQLGATTDSNMMAKARASTNSITSSAPEKKPESNSDVLAKMAEKMKKEEEDFLNFTEFCQIEFGFQPEERFTILNDILEKLTGLKFLKQIKKPEIKNLSLFLSSVSFQHRSSTDEEIMSIKNSVKYD